ncbi:MAG: tRNA (adenine-N1)-methyltransferase [Nitrospiraceae bacterium]|nr:tRNA (adenine-N1)-methyltransferase [Nitrospiraceae bacterium]
MNQESSGGQVASPGGADGPGSLDAGPATEAPFKAGERVLAFDERRRSQLIVLVAGSKTSTHLGAISHDDIIGAPPGSRVRSGKEKNFVVVRPTLAEAIEAMPRGAQVIYPKDLGQILMAADIRPGQRVLESGVGSGALSMALLNAGALVTGFELREDFANRARNNVGAYLGAPALARYSVQLRDIYDGVDGGPYDRVLLDLPEPWEVLGHLQGHLAVGGIVLAYQTSVGQLEHFRNRLRELGYILPRTVEVLTRSWFHSAQALRPEHSMVGHTGFLTWARMPPAG